MTLILKGKVFFRFLEGSPAKEGKSPEQQQQEEREEMKASATIMGSLSIKVKAQIPGESPSPKEIWNLLLKLYDQSAAGSRMQLKGDLASLKYSDFKDRNEFVQKP
ncbi:hypothetical protein V1508DRAFT_432905 [Lipomyces doorenjongii]|uniref:uncharacterized protein n=1 Tax=Lipomyces doorenjongii TaxID=383834 RepID=UPI0034CD2242